MILLIPNKMKQMKWILIIMLITGVLSPAFAQNDFIAALSKQAVEIDSLKKAVKAEMASKLQLSKKNDNLQDTIKKLRSDLANLEAFRNEKKNIDTILRQKTDSIVLLKDSISEMAIQIANERQKRLQKATEEYGRGKNEISATIVNSYKTKPFDELLKSSTKQSVQRDLGLVENNTEVKLMLSDIEKYLSAKELLDGKADAAQIKSHQVLLEQIKRDSEALKRLKEMLGNYQTFNDGLKETIGKIIALDEREAVSGMGEEIQKKKLDKILAELSTFIFNYDFNFSDYPYLSDILLELIKRKQPNADANISDLYGKL